MPPTQMTRPMQAYFDEAAETYDQAFTHTVIGRAERDSVWQELGHVFHSGQRILEMNCGTGVDAIYLAERGLRVLACDISARMIDIARRRSSSRRLGDILEFRVLATEDISTLSDEAPFDGAFSNFAGLNCVEDLSAIARNLARLVKAGAQVLLCVSGHFVPLEIAWHLAHGRPRRAMRRFKHGGTVGHTTDDGKAIVHYPTVETFAHLFAPDFQLRQWRGIGVTMPPAYFEPWAQRFPKAFDLLAKADRWVGRLPGLRRMAGHALLQFERVRDDRGRPLASPAMGVNEEPRPSRPSRLCD
jgi:ubiquinone/menaquinone biosynthesis C-methylase UbiE